MKEMAQNDLNVFLSIRRHLIIGASSCVLLVCGIGGWATAMNLAGAIIAPGTFVVDSYVKKLQHPTGGIVGDILVHEGQRVNAGDVLLRLDATQTRAKLAIVTKRLDELLARQARLEAERDDQHEITFPDVLISRMEDANVTAAVNSERRLFQFRRDSRSGEKLQLHERIEQYENEIRGLKAKEAAFDRGLAVLETEIASLKKLYDKALISVQRLNSLEREAAILGGDRGEAISGQARAEGRISETKLQILQIDSNLKTEVASELREIQGQIGECIERKVAAEDELKRVEITAPQSGTVHQLTVHTVDGVVSPTDVLMLIVPNQDKLLLEAQITPQDVDQIQVGQKAVLRLSAFNQRTTPELIGNVSRIAADLTHDERTGRSYYLIRISVTSEELASLPGMVIVPGMPAEAFIQTGERAALSYFTKPLQDQIRRAFREE